ncbi:MAG TPA: hypothetical protein VI248_29795 [Kineosporiaceae bacterium]
MMVASVEAAASRTCRPLSRLVASAHPAAPMQAMIAWAVIFPKPLPFKYSPTAEPAAPPMHPATAAATRPLTAIPAAMMARGRSNAMAPATTTPAMAPMIHFQLGIVHAMGWTVEPVRWAWTSWIASVGGGGAGWPGCWSGLRCGLVSVEGGGLECPVAGFRFVVTTTLGGSWWKVPTFRCRFTVTVLTRPSLSRSATSHVPSWWRTTAITFALGNSASTAATTFARRARRSAARCAATSRTGSWCARTRSVSLTTADTVAARAAVAGALASADEVPMAEPTPRMPVTPIAVRAPLRLCFATMSPFVQNGSPPTSAGARWGRSTSVSGISFPVVSG